MASRAVHGFEELIAWQRAMELATRVYELSRSAPFCKDFALCDQIHRSVISIASNIAEGYERGSRAEFHRFLTIAKGSCGETRTQLQLATRLGYINDENETLNKATEVSQIISKLRSSVARQRDTSKQ